METATEFMDRAIERRRHNARFRALAISVAMESMRRIDGGDREMRQREHEIAETVAMTLLEAIYDNDAELKTLQYERDAYRKIAEDSLKFMPSALMIVSR